MRYEKIILGRIRCEKPPQVVRACQRDLISSSSYLSLGGNGPPKGLGTSRVNFLTYIQSTQSESTIQSALLIFDLN